MKKFLLTITLLVALSVQNAKAQAGTGCNGGNELTALPAGNFSPNYILGTLMTLPTGGRLTGLSMAGHAGTGSVLMGLYANNAGVPGALLATSSSMTIINGTNTMAVTPINLTAGSYWVMANYNIGGGSGNSQTGSPKTVYYTANTFGTALPASGAGFTSYGGTDFQYWMNLTCAPAISSYSPAMSCAGTASTVVITGTNFTGATAVTVGGVNVTSFVVNSATQITAQVAADVSGMITVTTPAGAGTAAKRYIVAPVPAISPSGSAIACTSQLLTAATTAVIDNNNTVSIGGVSGIDIWQSFTPAITGLTTGLEVVTNGCPPATGTLTIYSGLGVTGTVVNTQSVALSVCNGAMTLSLPNLNLTAGSVYTFRFQTATTLGLTANQTAGGSFYSNTYGANTAWRVLFKTYVKPALTTVQWYNNDVIIAGATSPTYTATTTGTYTCKNYNGSCYSAASNATALQVNTATAGICVAITSFTPASLCSPRGGTIVITGTGFTGATAVAIGATNATSFTVNSATQITAVVPAATSGIIKVTTPGGYNLSGTALGVTPMVSIPITLTAGAAPTGCSGTQIITATVAPVLDHDEQNDTGAEQGTRFWQTFVPSVTGQLSSLMVEANGNYTAGIQLVIYDGVGTGGSARYAGNFTVSGGNWQTFTLGNILNLTAGNTYTFEINSTPSANLHFIGSPTGTGSYYNTITGLNPGTTLAFKTYFKPSYTNYYWYNSGVYYNQGYYDHYPATVSGNYNMTADYTSCFTGTSNTVAASINAIPTGYGPYDRNEYNQSTVPNNCAMAVTYTHSIIGTPTPSATYSFSGATSGSGSGTGSGLYFNKGTTTVNLTFTNSCGTKTASFTVTVLDYRGPTIVAPSNITVCYGTSSASVLGTATATDNCGVTSITNDAPATFTSSRYVYWYAYDAAGNYNYATQYVTVQDNINPTITAPANITVCQGTGINLGTPVTSDNCGVATVTNNAPSTFPNGTTTVTWTVRDTSNRTSQATQLVTVQVPLGPTITTTSSMLCTGQSALLNAVDPNTFFIGFNTQNWVGSSQNGGSVNTSLAPSSIRVNGGNAVSGGGTSYQIGPISSTVGVNLNFSWTHTSTSPSNEIATYYVGGGYGGYYLPGYNTGSTSQSDSASIYIYPGYSFSFGSYSYGQYGGSTTVFSNISAVNSGGAATTGTINWYTAATGGTFLGSSQSGADFTVSPTVIGLNSYYAETVSTAGCPSARTLVTVGLNQAPVITCIPNQTASTSSNACTATVTYDNPTTEGVPTLSYVFTGATTASGSGTGSGSTFNKGVTTVTITNSSCGMAQCSFTVTVNDTVNPTISVSSYVEACTGESPFLPAPITSDNCAVASVTNNAPAIFPVGVTTVTWTVTDTSGNTATASQTVSVSVPANPSPTASPATICLGQSSTLSTTIPNNGFSGFYSPAAWTLVNTYGGTVDTSAAPASITLNALPPGSYYNMQYGRGVLSATQDVTVSFNWSYTNTEGGYSSYPLFYSGDNWSYLPGWDQNNTSQTGVASIFVPAGSIFGLSANYNWGPGSTTVISNFSATNTNSTINYYTVPTGGTAIGSAPQGSGFTVTPAVAGVSSYYAETVSSAGCKSGRALVTVNVNANPTITCIANQIANATTGICGAVVIYGNPTLGTPAPTLNYVFSGATTGSGAGTGSGSTFNKGVTTVTLTATNSCTATCTFTVTIIDSVLPTITAPPTVNAFTTTACTATGVVLGTPTTADNCAVASVTNNAPATYPIGNTTVTWTVTDTTGNIATATQTVTVTDNVNPTITAPSNIAACQGTTIVLGTPVTADNCGVASVTNNAPGSYPAGVTTVTWTVTDTSGRTATATQTVTIDWPISPVASATPSTICLGQSTNLNIANTSSGFTGFYAPASWTIFNGPNGSVNTAGAPASISMVSGNGAGAGNTDFYRGVLSATANTTISFNWSYSTLDTPQYDYPQYLVNGAVTLMSGFNISGSQFQSGTATIVVPAGQTFALRAYTVDGYAGAATIVYTNFNTYSYAPGTLIKWYTASTGGTLLNTVSPGTNYTVTPGIAGTLSYYAEAVNPAGCTSTRALVAVTVNSAAITCIANQTANTTAGLCSAVVTYAAPTTYGTNTLTYVLTGATTGSGSGTASGATFNKGVTTVTINSTNSCGTGQCSFTVTVTDNINPTISAPANVMVCPGAPVVLGTPITADNCGVASVTNNAPGSYPVGITNVTWTVTDTSGRTATAIQTVTIDVPENPIATATPASICAGQSSNLSISNIANGFTGAFAPANWAFSNPANGSVNTTAAPTSISMTSGNWAIPGNVDFSRGVVSATANTTITFNWSSSTSDGPNWDYPQYVLNGVAIVMPGYNLGGSQNQGGTASIVVPAGQTFALRAFTVDGGGGAQTIVYTNFIATPYAPGTTISWFTVATGGTSIGSSAAGANLSVTPPSAGANAYYAEAVTAGGCKSAARSLVTVTVNGAPTITCIANQTANTTAGLCAAVVTYNAPSSTGSPTPTITYAFAGATTGSGTGTGSGSTFNKGVTTVTLTATNSCGSAQCSFTVTVIDTVVPTITAPPTVNASTNSGCSAIGVVLGTPTTADNCAVASVTNNAPTTFPKGNTIVTWTVTDASGNIATANQTVTVIDNVNPTITAPATIVTSANSGCSATGVVLGNPVTADNCSVATVTNNAPAAFPSGNTIVTWTVTDTSGHTALATQTVTVSDTINPTITAPATVFANTNAGCTATGVSLGTPITADNCTVASVTNNAPAAFPIGNTTVIWTVTDASGNTAIATQTITVSDNVNPTISAPATVFANTTAGCTATGIVLGTPITADNCTVSSVTNNAPTAFPVGNTTVTWTVTDGSGHTATANQTVTVIDNVNPTITAPATVSANANAACTATGLSLGTPVTADNCTVASVTNNAPAAFPSGSTIVTWTVTDASGNTATATQTVTVIDSINPTITAPATVFANTNAGCTATGVSLGTTITADNCTVASVTNNAPAAFPIGNTTVTWTVTDASGNTALATQTVTVSDNVNPTISAPSTVFANTTAGCTATGIVLGTPITADNCSAPSLTNNAPAAFPVGNTIVTWTATDASGNTATANQTVTVTDNTNPTITAPANVTVCDGAAVVLGTPVTADNCSVVNVSNNAPSSYPTGNTTLTWTVTDGSGNTATATQIVTVGANTTYYADADNDGYGNSASPISTCAGQPANTSTNATDCDDSRADVNPGYVEVGYDLVDNDCDGLIDEGFTQIGTVVGTVQCNTVLAAIDSYVYANIIANAQAYRWRITTMSGSSTGQVQFADSYLRNLRLTQLASYAFNTVYKIEVSVKYHGFYQPYTASTCTVSTPETLTSLSSCGGTLTSMSDVIYANIVPFATGYRFRVTNVLNPADTQTIDRQLREFRMNFLINPQYNASYNVQVAIRNTDGNYLAYGPVCTIATPTFPTTQVQDSQCELAVIHNMNTTIYADAFTAAQGYRFKLTNVALNYLQEVDRVLRTFSLNNFTGLVPAQTYTVRVALKLNGIWGPYGKACAVTVPGVARMNATEAPIIADVFKASAYPNPFASDFKLQITTASPERVEVSVYDMIGKLIEVRKVSVSELANQEIGQRYPSGVYNVVISQDENVRTLRVIKR